MVESTSMTRRNARGRHPWTRPAQSLADDGFQLADMAEGEGPRAAAHLPAGAWTRFGPVLREPIDLIHWAGSETAQRWMGYVEGAIESGNRYAEEALAPSRRTPRGAGHRRDPASRPRRGSEW